MSCLGVHFAITQDEVESLKRITDDRGRVDYVQEVIEENYFANHKQHLAQSDKAWDAIHRALADGELTWDGGEYPLNHVILAGDLLYTHSDYIISLKDPSQVKDIAAALPAITEAEFRTRYFAINRSSYDMHLSEEDFGYSWESFLPIRDLYERAAQEGRSVIFTADQ